MATLYEIKSNIEKTKDKMSTVDESNLTPYTSYASNSSNSEKLTKNISQSPHVVNLVAGIFVRAYNELNELRFTERCHMFGIATYKKEYEYDSSVAKQTPWISDSAKNNNQESNLSEFHYYDKVIKYCGDFEYYQKIFSTMLLVELNDMLYLLSICLAPTTTLLEHVKLIITYVNNEIIK